MKPFTSQRWIAAALFVGFCFPSVRAWADPPKVEDKKSTASQFMRLQKDRSNTPLAMETSIIRFKGQKDGKEITVDLVGVVHMADAAYYRKLNQLFRDYDVVLYELVAPKGTRVPKGGANSDNPLAMIQKIMTMALGLESQTAKIDYHAKNFVHADMSPTEMAEAMRKRGDTPLTLFLSALADMLRQQNIQAQKSKNDSPAGDLPDLSSLLSDPKALTKLKAFLAVQLVDMGEGALGKTLNTLLVDDRNKACLKVMDKELADGKTKIAIFYGAAHMPDFEKRLVKDYGLKRDSVRWLQAWDLEREVSLESLLLRLLLDQLTK